MRLSRVVLCMLKLTFERPVSKPVVLLAEAAPNQFCPPRPTDSPKEEEKKKEEKL